MKKFLCILAAMVFAAASLYGQPEAGHYGTVTDEVGDTVSIFLKAFPTVNISSRSRAWATA